MRGDPTIPRHRARGTRGVTTGRLVYYDEQTIALRDKHGNSWSLSSVSFAVGHWGSVHEGVEKLPRPWRYDSEGQPTVRGDLLLVDFVDGDPSLPIVLGVVRSTKPTDFLAYNHRLTGGKSNRLRLRLAPLDSEGNETGEIRVKMADDDSGTVEVSCTDSMRLGVGSDLDGSLLELQIDGDKVTVSKGGVAQALVQADFETDLGTYLSAMEVFVGALATAVPAAAAAVTAFTPFLTAFQGQVATGHTTSRLDAE